MRTNHFPLSDSHQSGGQMKLTRGLVSLAVVFSLGLVAFLSVPPSCAIAQESTTALQRGYRTGYSDGYMAGYRDSIDNKTKDFTRDPDYGSASRAYSKEYGTIEDYRDGYKQGFETGYDSGFEKRTFDSDVPPALTIRERPTRSRQWRFRLRRTRLRRPVRKLRQPRPTR